MQGPCAAGHPRQAKHVRKCSCSSCTSLPLTACVIQAKHLRFKCFLGLARHVKLCTGLKGAHLMWRGLISCEGGSSHVEGAHLIWRGLISCGGGSSHVEGAHLMWRGLISCEGGSSHVKGAHLCCIFVLRL